MSIHSKRVFQKLNCVAYYYSDSDFTLQICHAKTFKMRYTRCPYKNANLKGHSK